MAEKVVLPVSVEDNASDKLKAIAQAGQELEQVTKSQADAASKAAAVDAKRSDGLSRKREQLVQLQRRELAHEQSVRAAGKSELSAIQISQRRQRQIGRLSRDLALESEAQRRATDAVKGNTVALNQSVAAHRAAATGASETGEATSRADTAVRGLRGAFGALGISLTASGGVLLALRLVSAELENIRQLQQEAFQEQVTLASAQRQLKRNLVGATDEEIEDAIEGANKVARDRNVPNEIVTLALADALSSTGGDAQLALRNVDLASQVIPDQPDQIPVVAGALGDIQSAIGTDDAEVALGFLLATTGQSRITDFNRAATNIPPAVQAAVAQGFTPAESGALFSTFTTSTSDRTGESSRTAVIQFASELSKFAEEHGLDERGGEALRRIQQDAALREEFSSSVNIEQRARETVAQLVTPGTPQAQAFIDRQSAFGSEEELDAAALDKIRQLESGSLEETARLNRVLKSTTETLLANNEGFGRVGAIQDELSDLLRATGSPALGNKIAGMEFDLSSFNSSDAALKKLDDLLERRLLSIVGGVLPSDPSNPRITDSREAAPFVEDGALALLNDDQRRAVQAIEDALDEISEFRDLGPVNEPGNALRRLNRQILIDRAVLGLRFKEELGIDEPNTGRGVNQLEARFREEQDGVRITEPDSAPGDNAGSSLGPSIINQTIINGTQINNSTDPATGDRELVRRRVS